MATSTSTRSTFLPLLDELLSPDYQQQLITPVQYEQKSLQSIISATEVIQRWWRSKRRLDKYREQIRSDRQDEYVGHLHSEIRTLRAELEKEKRIRTLQMEAIKKLWAEVQRLDGDKQLEDEPDKKHKPCTDAEFTHPCSCAAKLDEFRASLGAELTDLRKLVAELKVAAPGGSGAGIRPTNLNLPTDLPGYASELAGKILH